MLLSRAVMLYYKHKSMSISVLYIVLQCTVLIYGATIHKDVRNRNGSTSNTCGSEFICNSGQCISQYLVCDGTEDCTDGSDERYGSCYAIQCPVYAYRCAYGACIDGNSKCNGITDCVDGSDELVEICGTATIVSGNGATIIPGEPCPLPPQPRNGRYTIMEGVDYRAITYTCAPNYQLYPANYRTAICQNRRWLPGHPICISSNTTYNGDQNSSNGSGCTDVDSNSCRNKFTCTNGQCIERHLLCDGMRDCEDGSDETVGRCSIIPCRKYSFRCAYGACVDSVAQCNGITECADGSDESPKICDSRILAASQNCTLPSQPDNGEYTLKQHKGALIITYKCVPHYDVYPVSNKLAICLDGQWVPGLAKCLRTCAPLISQSVETYCDLDGVRQNCSTTIFDGTTMRMRCKQPYVQAGGALNPASTCRNGTWDTAFINCVPAEVIW